METLGYFLRLGMKEINMAGFVKGISGKSSISPELIEAAAWFGEEEWVAEALSMAVAPMSASSYFLVGIDPDGGAHRLSGTLSTKATNARILESLETPELWEQIGETEYFSCDALASSLSLWPKQSRMGARFYKRQGNALGVLLIKEDSENLANHAFSNNQAKTKPTDRNPLQVADCLLVQVLQHWRVQRSARAMSEFTRALIGAQRCGILAIDSEGRVTYLSHLAKRILGVETEEILGADCTRVIRPSADGDHPLLKGLAGELEQVELYIKGPQGNNLAVSLDLKLMKDASGTCQGLVCLIRDFTEERAVEQEARRRERLAVIGELAAGAAHEIRNPLTGIGNCAQVLQMRLGERENERKMADMILREAQRLENIITSLLGFARPGVPHLQETQIEEVTREALELEQPVYEKRSIRCEFRVIGMIPPIYVDPGQIRQVLINLMRNGVDAMPDGGQLTLEISVARRQLHGRRKLGRRATDRVHVPTEGPLARFVRMRVKDTGKGIPQEKLLRIFDPFFTTRSEGTGLGLSVSQSIVQEHGGFISIQSVEGRGSTFDVDLPVERRHGERRKEK